MLNLRTKFVLALLLVSLGSVSSLGWVAFKLAQRQLIELRGQELRALVLNQKRDLRHTLVAWEDRAKLIASRTQLRKSFAHYLENSQAEHAARMKRILTDALGSTRQVASITLCDPAGDEVVSVRKENALHGGCAVSPNRAVSTYGIQDVWEHDGSLRILVRTPLLDNQKLVLGDALVILGGEELVEVLGNVVGLGESGETLMVREVPPSEVEIFGAFRHRRGPGPLTALFPFEDAGLLLRHALEGKEEYFSDSSVHDYRGVPVLAASAKLPELGWGLVAKIDREEALAPAADFGTRTLYLSASVALVALALGWFFSRHITVPLAQLAAGARLVTAGNELVRVNLDRRDELGELGFAFNAMLERLSVAQEERNQLISELTHINRRLEDFAHIAAHDLRGPLRHVKQLAGWLAEDLKDGLDEGSARHLALLTSRVERLEHLLEDLLAYARAGHERSPTEDVDLRALSEESFLLVSGEEQAELIWNGKRTLLQSHSAPLALILRNLIGNALKHNEGLSVTVTVSARFTHDWCHLTVADDGCGIEEGERERVFDLFHTLSSRDKREGSGVGLSIVSKTVEAYGGTVSLRANAPTGCIFSISWPLSVEGKKNVKDGVAPNSAA